MYRSPYILQAEPENMVDQEMKSHSGDSCFCVILFITIIQPPNGRF